MAAKSRTPSAREVARQKAEESTAKLNSYVKQVRNGLRQLKGLESSLRTTLGLIESEVSQIREQLRRAGVSLADVDQAEEEAA